MLRQGSRGEELTWVGLTATRLSSRCSRTGLGRIRNSCSLVRDLGCRWVQQLLEYMAELGARSIYRVRARWSWIWVLTRGGRRWRRTGARECVSPVMASSPATMGLPQRVTTARCKGRATRQATAKARRRWARGGVPRLAGVASSSPAARIFFTELCLSEGHGARITASGRWATGGEQGVGSSSV
jgi:hypothetical protein